jgi:hypothetical protein
LDNNESEQYEKNKPETGSKSDPEMMRREFIKRFGKYAAGSAEGLFVLMSPSTSKKAMCASDGGPPP